MLNRLYAQVSDFFRRARVAQPAEIICREGCADCCRQDLSVFQVEARRIRAALLALPSEDLDGAARRARRGEHCCLLEPGTRRCLVYEARPLICRSHGLAVAADGEVTACPLNYRTTPPRREHILNLEGINQPLVLINRMDGGDGTRIRLTDLVGEVAQGRG